MERLKEKYTKEVLPALQEKYKYPTPMMVGRLTKVTINMGVGEAKTNAKLLDAAVQDMTTISGQKPVVTKARNSVSNFKLREGMPIGCKVTLRGKRMWTFLDKLFNIVLPRVKDFRGINPNSFDGRGSFAFGIQEQIVFPEINYDKIDEIRGMDICITTTARSDEEAHDMLSMLGMPFKKR